MNMVEVRQLNRAHAPWMKELKPPFIIGSDNHLSTGYPEFYRDLVALFSRYEIEPLVLKDEEWELFDATGLRLRWYYVSSHVFDIDRVGRTDESRAYLREALMDRTFEYAEFRPGMLEELTDDELIQWCVWLFPYQDAPPDPIPDNYEITERDRRYWTIYRQEMLRMVGAFLNWEWLEGEWAEAAELEGRRSDFKPELNLSPPALFTFNRRVNDNVMYALGLTGFSVLYEKWHENGRDVMWEVLRALERYPDLEEFFAWSQNWEIPQPPNLDLLDRKPPTLWQRMGDRFWQLLGTGFGTFGFWGWCVIGFWVWLLWVTGVWALLAGLLGHFGLIGGPCAP